MNKADHIQPYKEFVRPFYSDKDVGHNYQHIERIISRLDELKEGIYPQPSLRKLNFLSCFHGLVSKTQNESAFKDEIVKFLKNLDWESQDIKDAFDSLARHLSGPVTSEEMIVHDANYLEVTGALGIAKAFTVGGARTQTYEETLEIFESNLNKAAFRTPYGKKHYEERKAYARVFIDMLRTDLRAKK